MSENKLYILKNKSFGKNIFKIGKTTKNPDLRAKAMYSGATGVPEPFNVIFACGVANCNTAEIKVHRRLAAYRINDSREFFRIPFLIARKIIIEVCTEINIEYNCEHPVISIDITNENKKIEFNDRYQENIGKIYSLPFNRFKSQPINTSVLSKNQKERISLISDVLAEVDHDKTENWNHSFSCDTHPEGEIRIWEHIAKAFLKIEAIDYFSLPQKKEAFSILLQRSLSPSKYVLRKHRYQYLNQEIARKIMSGYELSPKPLTVREPPVIAQSTKIIHPTPIAIAIRNLFIKK